MQKLKALILLFGVSLSLLSVQAAASYVSDGSDGAFAPASDMTLSPDEDGIFHYSTIDILDPVLVTIDPQDWTDDIYLLATGNINLSGLLNFADTTMHLHTPGSINLSGQMYGSGTLNLHAGEVHLTDNPNGSADQHYTGGVSLIVIADGEYDPASTSGVVITSTSFDFQIPELEFVPPDSGVTITFEPPNLATPLPGALWVFVPALGLLARFRKR